MNMNIKLNPTQQATLEYVTEKTGWSPPALIELFYRYDDDLLEDVQKRIEQSGSL